MLVPASEVCYVVFYTLVLISLVHSEDVPDPVALFPLNSLHTTKDISNSHLTAGTAVGVSLAPGPDGKPGGSYHFPGSARSYIEIPQQTKLDTRYSITILAWIYNEGTAGSIVRYEPGIEGVWSLHLFMTTASSLLFKLSKRSPLKLCNALIYDMGSVNTWRYVGYTYDYNTGYQRLFVDGMKVAEGLLAFQEIATNYKIVLGGFKDRDARIFKGRMSCLQIYNTSLTQSQVQAVKAKCIEKDDVPDPVALFPLNSLHITKDISNSHLTAGTAVGVSLAPGPDGKPGGSYYFPGSASSYIEIPQQNKLDTRYSISLLVWVYNEGLDGPIVHYDAQTSTFAFHIYIATTTALFVRVTQRNSLSFFSPFSHDIGPVNTWKYIGYTYDYSSGTQRLFVDGVKVKEGNIGQHEISTNYKIKIGGAKYGDARLYKGRISCLQIYDKALTPTQIQAVKDNCIEKNELYSSCFRYTVINDPTRATYYKISGQSPDRQALKRRRWYRLKGKIGTRIVTSCPAAGSCGSQSPGWLNGQYPSLETGIKKMEICYRKGSNCCGNNATVYVRQCYGYPVFMLDDVPDISLGNRICTEIGLQNALPSVMFKSTNERCLSGHVMYQETNVIEALQCMGYCLNAGEKCKSFNFIEQDNGTCQLNNATMTDYPLHVTVDSSCTYYHSTTMLSYIIT